MIRVHPERQRNKPIEIEVAISLENMRDALMEESKRFLLPVEVKIDNVKIGTGLGNKTSPCIVIYHRQHKKDYYSIVLIFEKHYNSIFATTYLGGNSKNFVNSLYLNNKNGLIERKLKQNTQKKLDEEHLYYNKVDQLIVSAYYTASSTSQYQRTEHSAEATKRDINIHASNYTDIKKRPTLNKSLPKQEQQISSEKTKKEDKFSTLQTIMLIVWIILAIISLFFGGLSAILTDIAGFVIINHGEKLIQDNHKILAIILLFMGGGALCCHLIAVAPAIAAFLMITLPIVHYFSCLK